MTLAFQLLFHHVVCNMIIVFYCNELVANYRNDKLKKDVI